MNEIAVVISRGEDSREVLTDILEELGFLVADVETTEQAAVVLRSFKCYLVLWDIHNSIKSRDAVVSVRLLESIAPETPIVLLAGAEPDAQLMVLGASARRQVRFLTKPIATETLRKTIEATRSLEPKRLEV